MAKNKYASINFNHVYEKSFSSGNSNTNRTRNHTSHPSPSSAPSYSAASYSAVSSPNKSHGRMLVLTKPTPKQVVIPQTSSATVSQQRHSPLQNPAKSPLQQPTFAPLQQQPQPNQSKGEPGSDAISLRPLGRTGTCQLLSTPVLNHDKDKEIVSSPVTSPKPDKFVPPHLRPGYVRREEKPVLEPIRFRDVGQRYAGHHEGHPGSHGEDGRPKSGWGKMRTGGSSDMGIMARPISSGWKASGMPKELTKARSMRSNFNTNLCDFCPHCSSLVY